MCSSSISSLGLFQGIIGDIETLKEETLESWITGGTNSEPSSYSIHVRDVLFASLLLWERLKFAENACLAAMSYVLGWQVKYHVTCWGVFELWLNAVCMP